MTINDVVVMPFNKDILDKTAQNTIKKFSYTNPTLMYGRTPVELLDNIFMGDLAKNSLIYYLRSKCNNQIIDYDEIRNDNFHEADPGWDFKVGNNKIPIEVKSSTPPNNENYSSIISRRDIKITASHDNGRTWIDPESLESDIHIQVYFYARPYKNGYDTHAQLQNILNENPNSIHNIINSDKYKEPLFFGWNTKRNIILYKNNLKPSTWSFGWTNRVYWRCPISQAFNLDQLIQFINSH